MRSVVLPIDPLLPEIVARLRESGRLVVEAPPGAGKTTRIPSAILDAGLVGDLEVLVLEPRRLAARLAARHVAASRGEPVGEGVGYQVRFEDVGGPRTRLRYVTEGVLARRLAADPLLSRVGAVVLDEFHERHLVADVALASLRVLQETKRPDLRLLVMSATLDAKPVVDYLGGCPRVTIEGRAHPVEIEMLARKDDRFLEVQVAAALAKLLGAGLDGDVLVFLPGAAEIRRCLESCRDIAAKAGADLLPLHGDLTADEQDRAVRPSARRKVLLATNVAETSVTIEGVVAVIDTGLARVASHSPWSGLPVLETEKISQASAAQRAGRAGRTRPGRCVRLYTQADFDAREAHTLPEVARADLCEALLELRASGVDDLDAFPWFTAPPRASLEAAEVLLSRLGAVDGTGRVTEIGRRMLAYPLHPRISRLVVDAVDRGVAEEGAAVAGLLSERDLRLSSRAKGMGGPRGGGSRALSDTGTSDVIALLDAFEEARALSFDGARCRSAGIDASAARAADRVRAQVARIASRDRKKAGGGEEDLETALRLAVLAGFPDRVAGRRRAGSPEVLLCGGGSATLAEESAVRTAPFLVAVDAQERPRGGPLVRIASAIELEWLVELFPDLLVEDEVARWDATSERVEVVRRTLYDALVLEEKRGPAHGSEAASRVLATEALKAGARAFAEAEDLDRLRARTAFAAEHAPSVRPIGDEDVARVLQALCVGRGSFEEVRRAGLGEALLADLGAEGRRALDSMAPERVVLHGGWSPRVEYAVGRPPWIEAFVQDFFGLREGPRVARDKVPVVLHLSAPNHRPVQVTTDLAGFWARQWPAVRRELSRRYPRHAWPEDPLTASPPPRKPPRRQSPKRS